MDALDLEPDRDRDLGDLDRDLGDCDRDLDRVGKNKSDILH